MRIVLFGTFDLVHAGHVHVLSGLASLGELVVALGTDKRTHQSKGKWPILTYAERFAILDAFACVQKIVPISPVPMGLASDAHHLEVFHRVGADAVGIGVTQEGQKDSHPLEGLVPEVVIPKRILSTTEILERIARREERLC